MFRTKKFFVIYSCICIFSSSTVIAQLKIDADIRPRFEYRHGFGNLFPDNAEPAVFVQQRTRLNIGYSINKIAIGLSVQDVSVWGDTPQISTSDLNDSFALFQAWISYQFNEYWSTKLGRQVLSYDDQRILGGLDWAQQGRFHDAALIRYNKDSFKIDLGFAFNQENVSNEGNDFLLQQAFSYKTMQYAHLHKTWSNFDLSFLFLNTGFQILKEENNEVVTDGVNFIQTTGFYFNKPYKNGKLFGSAYYQFGENSNKQSLSAYQFYVETEYKPQNTAYGIGFEMLSGSNQDDAAKTKSFTPLYGTNHKFNGYMDYFYVGNHANNVGLNDLYAKAIIKTGKKSNLLVKGHYFLANAKLMNDESKYLGTEIDLVYTLNPIKDVTLNVGYSQILASDSMSLIKDGRPNDNFNNWGWIRLMFKPTLFETKPSS